jgi:integrase
MPSLKAVVRKDVVNTDHKANIKIRVSHNRKVRYIATTDYIEPKYMGSDGIIKGSYPGQLNLNRSLRILLQQYSDIIAEIGPDIVYMDINSLISKLKTKKKHGSDFLAYMKFRTGELIKENRFSYAESYQVTINHLKDYSHKKEIQFNEITVGFLRDFEAHLRQVHECRVNTIRIYLNNIRSVFYHAIDSEIIRADISPFRKFKIAQERTQKRALDIGDLKILLKLRTSTTKQQQKALDIFFLIFYLIGINLKDLLYLKPGDVYKERLYYSRFKTGRKYSIKILPEAKEIIERYKGEKYLLRFLEEKEKISPKRLPEADHDFLSQINKLLRTMVKSKKLSFKITTYSARHSWATIASSLGISRDIISHALGHGIDTMTDTYIDFDLAKVDQANKKVINKLMC